MKTNAAGRKLIRDSEGLRLEAYQCSAGRWTIGYGHTGDVKPGMRITLHQAEAIFEYDLECFEEQVSYLTAGLSLTENEFSALVSFTFNVGADIDDDNIPEGLGDSHLLKLLRAGDKAGAAAEFMKWKHAAGKVVPGLVRRRAAERALFLSP